MAKDSINIAIDPATVQMYQALRDVAEQDISGLVTAQQSYGDSWKKRGGIGAAMNVFRKTDRLEQLLKRAPFILNGVQCATYDIFSHIEAEAASPPDMQTEAVLDAVRDARRYLLLIEAHLVAKGVNLPLARDNKPQAAPVKSTDAVSIACGRTEHPNPFGYGGQEG